MYTVRRELDPKDMRYYGSRVKNPAFSSFCMQMARELELNGISPDSLAADRIEDSVLSGKMHEHAAANHLKSFRADFLNGS